VNKQNDPKTAPTTPPNTSLSSLGKRKREDIETPEGPQGNPLLKRFILEVTRRRWSTPVVKPWVRDRIVCVKL